MKLSGSRARSHNLRARGKGCLLLSLGVVLPFAVALNFLAAAVSEKTVAEYLGKEGAESLKLFLSPVRGFWSAVPEDYVVYALATLTMLTAALIAAARWMSRPKATMSR